MRRHPCQKFGVSPHFIPLGRDRGQGNTGEDAKFLRTRQRFQVKGQGIRQPLQDSGTQFASTD